jgi:hypothetical protein
MHHPALNSLVLYYGAYQDTLRIFDDYCTGIKHASLNCRVIDYMTLYLELGRRRFEDRIFSLIRDEDIGIVFILIRSGDLTFSLDFLQRLSVLVPIVINFFDSEHFFERIDRHYAQAADIVLTPNPQCVPLFNTSGVDSICIFSLYDPVRYPFHDLEKSIDISFVGNMLKSERKHYIDALKKSGIDVSTFGWGTPAGIISQVDMVNVFNRSKINLNFSGCEESHLLILSQRNGDMDKQLKGRISEITLCGGFVLTEYAPDIEKMYKPGKEIEVFHDEAELKEKIVYYLENDEEREKIAARGRIRALRDYDSRTAFVMIFGMIGQRRASRPIITDGTFDADYVNFHFYYLVMFLLKGKFRHCLNELMIVVRHGRFNLCHAVGYAAIAAATFSLRYPVINRGVVKIRKFVYRARK